MEGRSRMNKRIQIFALVLLISLAGATAISNSSVIEYWGFDNNVLSNGSTDWVNTGGAGYGAGKLGSGAIEFNEVAETDYLTSANWYGGQDNITINMWITVVDKTENRYFMSDSGAGASVYWRLTDAADKLQPQDTTISAADPSTPTISDENFHMLTFVLRGDNDTAKVYLDNVLVWGNDASVGQTGNGAGGLYLGNYRGTGNWYDGRIDEMGVWSIPLSDDEISDLYNGGVGLAYPFNTTIPPPSNVGPNMTLNFPVNNTFSEDQLRVNVTVEDWEGGPLNVTLFIDSVKNFSMAGVLNGSTVIINSTILKNPATYDWFIRVLDNYSVSNDSETRVFTFLIEEEAQAIIVSPDNNAINKTALIVNATVFDPEGSQINVTLYVGNLTNATLLNVNNNTSILLPAIGMTELGNYSWWLQSCDNNSRCSNTTERFYFLDNVLPVLVTDFVNASLYYFANLSSRFNYSDNFLIHSVNITIDDIGIFSKTEINTSTYTYPIEFDPQNLTEGQHTIITTFADAHTAKELKCEFGTSNGLFNDYLRFELCEGGYVKIKNNESSIWDTFETKKEKDKFTFTYEPYNQDNKQTFRVESDQYIHIVETETKYQDFIVVGDHWVDFYIENETDYKVKIKRVSDYEVEVKLTGLKKIDKLYFSSIGDLNIVQENFTFYTTNASHSFQSIVTTLQNQTFSLTLNTTFLGSTDATFTYNGTEYHAYKTDNGDHDLWQSNFLTPGLTPPLTNESRFFQWNFTLFGNVTNESAQFNDTQAVFLLGADNCSTFELRGVNFTLKDETNSSLLNGSMDGYLKIWLENANNYSEFNLTWGGKLDNYGICIFPNYTNYTLYMQLEYRANDTKYNQELYYFINNSISNQTQQIDLLLTAPPTQVEFTVSDVNDDPIPGAIIKVLAYNFPTATYTTTEILLTDTDGIGLGQIILNSEWYAFLIEVDGEVRLQTLPTKITSATKRFRLGLEEKYIDLFTVTEGISHSLTFTNATSTFSLVFSDPSGKANQVCLDMIRRGLNSDSVLNESCLTTSSGTILLTIPENTSTFTYVATANALISGEEFFLDSITQSFNESYKKFGISGLFVTFIFILGLVMIGIWSPEIAVLLAIVGVIVSAVLGIFMLSWGFIVTLVILGGLVIYKISKK